MKSLQYLAPGVVGQIYREVTDWFVPIDVRRQPDAVDVVRRARIVVAMSLVSGTLVFSLFLYSLARSFVDPTLVVTLLSSVYYLCIPLVLRIRRDPTIAGILFIAPVFVIYPARSIGIGGINSSMATWYVLVPLMTTLLVSQRTAAWTTGIAVLEIGALTYHSVLHLGDPLVGGDSKALVLKGISLSVLLVITFATASLFETERRRAERTILDQQAKLRGVAKLMGVGEAASGVASELGDPLTAIHREVEMLRASVSSGAADRGPLVRLVAAAERIEVTVAALRELAPAASGTDIGDALG